MYKQKLKHVLSEHHNTVSELKMDGVATSSLIQNKHTESELRLRKDTHGLQADLREKQLQNENCIKELKLVRRHQLKFSSLGRMDVNRIKLETMSAGAERKFSLGKEGSLKPFIYSH